MELERLQQEAHRIAREHGFWEGLRNVGELIALMHSELSEALEAYRANDHTNLGEEMADVVIRVADFCEAYQISLADAVQKKMKQNESRPYRHGGKLA